MKKHLLITGTLALMVTACETVPTVPNKHPMTQAAMTQMGDPNVHLQANHVGVGASWFMVQSNGAGAGMVGVIGAVIADAIINAIPSSRATKTANEVAESVLADDLNASLIDALKLNKTHSADGISLNTVSLVNGLDKSLESQGELVVAVNYTLAENASAFKVHAVAKYENADIPYATPYSFEGKVPKSHAEGPAYSNTFEFNTSQLETPVLTEALKVKLIKSVEDSFRDAEGNLPTEGSELSKMKKGIEKAKDDKLTKSETSVFLIQHWLKNDGAPMKVEINQAHAFIAKYLVKDLNSTDIPALDGEDKIIATHPNGRVVKLVGTGVKAGSYISEPGNVTSFTTYGNAVNYSKAGKVAARLAKKGKKGK